MPRIVEAANALIAHNQTVFERTDLPYSPVTDREGEILVINTAGEVDEGTTIAGTVSERLAANVPPDKIAVLASVGFLLEPAVAGLTEHGIHFIRVDDDPAAISEFARARLDRLLGGTVLIDDLDSVIGELVGIRSMDAMIRRLADLADIGLDDPNVDRTRQVIALAERESGVEPPASVGRRIALDWHRLSRQLQREAEAVKVMTTFVARASSSIP